MSRRASSLIAGVALATALGACSSSSGGGPCADYANALCSLYSSCSKGWYSSVLYGDQTACVAGNEAICTARLAVPQTTQNPTSIEACAKAIPTYSCEQLYGDDLPACEPPIGTFPSGAACEASAQCASAYCGILNGAICGTCQPAPMAGASCATLPCGPDLHCLAVVQTCEPSLADGGACQEESDCQFGLTCLSKALVCAPTAAAGQPCDSTGTIGPGCNDRQGLVCQLQPAGGIGICTLKSLVAANQPCGAVTAGQPNVSCLASGICQKTAGATTGVCQAAVGTGATCDTSDGPACLLPNRCVIDPAGDGATGTCEQLYTQACTAPDAGGGDGSFLAGGTFTVTGADSGAASATLTNFDTSLAQILTANDVYWLSIAVATGIGTSSAIFSTPAGITSYTFTAGILFTGAPTSGLTLSNTQSCGSVGMSFGTTARPFAESFEADSQGASCPSTTSTSGTWTLSLSSVTPVSGGLGNFYTAHGTLTATMPDGTGDTGALNLSF